jgi:hypothetical protein
MHGAMIKNAEVCSMNVLRFFCLAVDVVTGCERMGTLMEVK